MISFKQFKQQLEEKFSLLSLQKDGPDLRPNQMQLVKKILEKAKKMQDTDRAEAWANLQLDIYKRSHPEIPSKEIDGMKKRVELGLSK
jgi:hypothetical protein